MGIEPNIKEVSTFSDLINQQTESQTNSYLIICEDLLSQNKESEVHQILSRYLECRVMLISTALEDFNHPRLYKLNSASQKNVLELLEQFLFERDDENSSGDFILSEREIDVLKAVAQGYSNKEIADKLFISKNTVITHRKNITDKLDIKTIAGLTVYAILNKLIDPEEVRK